MTLEEKLQLVKFIEYSFTTGNTVVGYYLKDKFEKGEQNNVYTGEIYEYTKSTWTEPKVIYTQSTIIPKSKQQIDAKLDFFMNAFMLFPTGLAFIQTAMDHGEDDDLVTPALEQKIPFLNDVQEKGTPKTEVESHTQEVFILDCDTSRDTSVRIIPMLKEGDDPKKMEETFGDPRTILTSLCHAVVSMVKSIEDRDLESRGKAMSYAVDFIEGLYVDPDHTASDIEF